MFYWLKIVQLLVVIMTKLNVHALLIPSRWLILMYGDIIGVIYYFFLKD